MHSLVEQRRQPVEWMAIIAFFVLACAWSWPFFWWRDMNPVSFNALPGVLRAPLIMWGPGLAALVCWRVFRARWSRPTRIVGPCRIRALAFFVTPFVLFAVFGGVHPVGLNPSIIPVLALVALFNTLGEELGWRSYLQDALRPLPSLSRWALVGVMWCGWHFTNLFAGRTGSETALYLGWYLPSCVLLSVILGVLVDRTRCLLVAVTLHIALNVIFELGSTAIWPLLSSVPVWLYLIAGWPRPAGAREQGE